jgi:hypothetical protein
MRSSKIREYLLFKTAVDIIQPRTKRTPITERNLGCKNPSKTKISPDPNNVPTRTTVPLKKGLIKDRYEAGKRPIKTDLAGLFMVVLKTFVDNRA